jgi:hypothetical protein
MALMYDIEKDVLYKEGEIKGEIKSIQKAILRNKLTLEEMSEDFEVSLEFIEQVMSGRIK